MGDAEVVGEVERPRAFEDQLDDAVDRQQVARLRMCVERAAGDVFHDDVADVLGDHRVVDLDDVRVVELADQRGLVEEQVAVQLALFRVAQDAGDGHLDRHVALRERVAGEVDGAGRTFPEFPDQFVLAEFLLHGVHSRLRARAIAARTCSGAVPPMWLRAASEPSTVSTAKMSFSTCGQKALSSSSVSCGRSTPFCSAAAPRGRRLRAHRGRAGPS